MKVLSNHICTLFYIHTTTFFNSISSTSLIFYIRFSHSYLFFIVLVSFSQTLTTTKFLSQNWHFLLINNCYSFFSVFYFCSTISIGNFHLFKTNKNNYVKNTWTHLHKIPSKHNTCTHKCTIRNNNNEIITLPVATTNKRKKIDRTGISVFFGHHSFRS